MDSATELHIIAPGLCGPLSEISSLENNTLIKNWVKVLSKSTYHSSAKDVNDIITFLFKLSYQGDFPTAALSMFSQDMYDSALSYMFADPVHLQADMDHAILTPSVDLAVSNHESRDFCEMLNQHFNEDGLSFTKLNNDQWVISTKESIQINTTALVNAIGRNVNFILPKGGNSGQWKKTLTEAQMLMYSHDINTERERSGQQSINSLWFHGSGKLPDSAKVSLTSVCSASMVFKGLAKHMQCDYLSLPSSTEEYMSYILENKGINVLHLSDIEHLVNYTDVTIWLNKLEEILNNWLYPLIAMANKNNIQVNLYPCNAKQYQFSKYDDYKFWRQGKLEQHVSRY